jgi:hypothetical protein
VTGEIASGIGVKSFPPASLSAHTRDQQVINAFGTDLPSPPNVGSSLHALMMMDHHSS